MPERRIIVFALFFSMLLGASFGTTSHAKQRRKKHPSAKTQIHKLRTGKEAELTKLKQEIAKVQTQLKEHEKKEKASRRNLGAYNKRTEQLRQIIAALEAKAEALTEQKVEVDQSLTRTKVHLDSLKHAYAQSVTNFYMRGGARVHNDPSIVLAAGNAESIASADTRKRAEYYARLVGNAHSLGHAKLDSSRIALSDTKQQISATLSRQQELLDQRSEEQTSVEAERQSEQQRLQQLQIGRAKLERELASRKASARKLEGIIASLVQKEEASMAARKRRKAVHHGRTHSEIAAAETPESADLSGQSSPHTLQWPTASHLIKQGYGEHRNRELNTVTVNLGIDIGSALGSSVVAAADGIVSLVSSLPGYGTIIVIRHAGNLHTVYADLSGASVSRGTHVKRGAKIGRSGNNEELGPSVHFEVWKGRSKQNPAGWLR